MAGFSGAGGTGWFWSPDLSNVVNRINRMKYKTLARAFAEQEAFAAEGQEWMRRNHPWKNRTRTAESSLVCRTTQVDEYEFLTEAGYDIGIMMSHPDGRGKDYSVYLEGYLGLSILEPFEQQFVPTLLPRFSNIMTL